MTWSIITAGLATALAIAHPAVAQDSRAKAPAANTPTQQRTAPDKLQLARAIAAKLIPDGFYQKLMGDGMTAIIDSVTQSAGTLPLQRLVRASGISAEKASTLGDATLREVMQIYDPYWQERTRRGTRAMMGAMAEAMNGMEPRVREALAGAYSREFSLEELKGIDGFFATPAGTRFANKSMTIFMDPEMMKAMADLMPDLTAKMPEMIAAATEATRDLPAPRKNSDLTPAERKKLAALMGVSDEAFKKDAAQ